MLSAATICNLTSIQFVVVAIVAEGSTIQLLLHTTFQNLSPTLQQLNLINIKIYNNTASTAFSTTATSYPKYTVAQIFSTKQVK